jgi:two-component system cell cycle response regulator
VSGHRKLPLYLNLLGLSICLLVATDLLSAYTTTFNTYALGSWLDLGWQASAVATVLAVVCAGRTLPERSPELDDSDTVDGGSETTNALPVDRDAFGLAPLIAGAAGAFLVVISQASSDGASRTALVLAALTVGAVFLRLQLSIADQRAVSRRLDKALREQKQLAITDMLTDLYNRRFVEEVLRLTASRSDRENETLCVMILDLDRFKKVNDTYGHQAGDVVLAEVAARLRRTVRVADVVGRWGGEEFLVVFPVTDLAAALLVSDRIRRAVSAETIRLVDGTRITVTASVGVAEMVAGAGDVDTLLWQADQALYAAKEAGRDRVFAWDAQGRLVAYV